MMYTNAGILVSGLAALILCLQGLHLLFVIAILIILGLALANLVILRKMRAPASIFNRASSGNPAVAGATKAAGSDTPTGGPTGGQPYPRR